MHESKKVEAELGYIAKREESEDEWVVSRTISLPLPFSPLFRFPPPTQSRQTSLTREDESESLRIILVRDNQLSQRECVARIGIPGEIVEGISALEMPKRD